MLKLRTKNYGLRVKFSLTLLLFILIFGFCLPAGQTGIYSYAQGVGYFDETSPVEAEELVLPKVEVPFSDAAAEAQTQGAEFQRAVIDNLSASQNVTLDFKNADIRNVLKIIAYKSKVNIVASPEVIGNISIRLVDVPWEKALDVILKTHGFGYERQANIITVAPIDKLTAQKKQEVELAQVQPTVTEVFNLRYLDAQDAKKALDSQLSPRGKITVLEMTGQAGWEFGAQEAGKRKRISEEKMGRSKVLIVSDIPPVLDKIKEVVAKIDTKPEQILIQARLIEVNKDKLRDIGFDFATGSAGAEAAAITGLPLKKGLTGNATQTMGGHVIGSLIRPSGFNPKAGIAAIPGVHPFNVGFELLYKKLTGEEFEIMIHALEENVHANILSAPKILALNNQEATILVNTKYPILKQETTTSGSTPVTTTTLDYYQDIGIQLNVVPQIAANNAINMVVHPVVTSYTDTLGTNQYPIIQNREAETRILMDDGQTIVIGGLIKDVKTKSVLGIPFLKDIPYIGQFFRRDTYDTEKIELLIFITANIVKEEDFTAEKMAKLEEEISTDNPLAVKKKNKKGKK